MKKILRILSVLIITQSCTSSKAISEKRCVKILKNNYKRIVYDKFETIVENDTLYFNEVKYECVYSSVYTKKVMYDQFGKWTEEIYRNDQRHPMLLWKNVKLFPNDTTKFTVVANGVENMKTIYASILVFDNNNNDLLSENSKYQKNLIDYFSELIKNNNSNNKKFHTVYKENIKL